VEKEDLLKMTTPAKIRLMEKKKEIERNKKRK